jgi:UTP--glucose-1-phosphate uridylyltransferase
VLSYVVAEARAAGIEHIVFITGRGKGAIEDYFDHQVELESALEAKGKTTMLDELRAELPREGQMSFVRQMQPHGLGHAVWCARDVIGDEPFAVLLPDVIMQAEPGALAQLIAAYDHVGGNVILVDPCPPEDTDKYGVVALERQDGLLNKMTGMVEKPPKGTEPSNLAISGRYILQPEIFAILEEKERGAGNEIQLTDAMAKLMKQQAFHALEYKGAIYDCGDKIGLLRANVALALGRADLGAAARAAVSDLLK